uniref:Uncharacterized protein n=1 Tax=Trichinella nativa TaxID=6335 RepID=A0A0V1KIF2_9BILA
MVVQREGVEREQARHREAEREARLSQPAWRGV